VAFYPLFLSGFARIPGDLGDARLIHYLLEHDYRWLRGDALHRDLWSPPIFYPAANAGAYSDILLSAVPFYACWRVFGVGPDTSFQLFMLTVASLNYWSMYLFLTRCPRLPGPASAAGAFLFAFASPRLVHVCHLQLHVHFYTVVCLYTLYRVFETAPGEPAVSRIPRPVWMLIASAAAVAQLYASFYLGWFLALGLAAIGAWALLLPSCRPRLLGVARAYPLSAVASVVLVLPALWWLARHYLEAARSTGFYPYDSIGVGLPNPALWFCRGPDCWLGTTRGLVAAGLLSRDPWPPLENALGIGTITTVLVVLGLWGARRSPLGLLLALAALTLLACFTVVWWPEAPDRPGKSLYFWVFSVVPAAGAVRVPGRVVLLLLIPAAVGLACFLSGRRPAVLALVLSVCLLEQGQFQSSYDRHENRQRIDAVARRVAPDAVTFVVWRSVSGPQPMDCRTHLDAMWAGLEAGVPTVNGYSGAWPPHWDLQANELQPGQDGRELEKALNDWLARHGLPPARVSRIHLGEASATPRED
jgi:hypothetical protein